MNAIHTFELCAPLTPSAYQLCRNKFFEHAKNHVLPKCCYEDSSNVVCNYWNPDGITIYLHKGQEFSAIYFRINPSKLLYSRTKLEMYYDPALGKFQRIDYLKPDALYFPCAHINEAIPFAFDKVLQELPIQIELDSLSLNRVDFCEDFLMPKSSVTAYLRVVRKSMCHPKWASDKFGDERDDYSVRQTSKRYQLTVYDKTYQMQNRFMCAEYDSDSRKLRVEAALLKEGICHMCEKYRVPKGTWYDTLFTLLESGSWLLADVLQKILPRGNYYTLAEAKKIIMASNYRHDRKLALIDFLTDINRNTLVSMYQLKRMKGGALRVQQLAYLGINIVTIDNRRNIPFLPSLYALIDPFGPYYATKSVMYCSFDKNGNLMSTKTPSSIH